MQGEPERSRKHPSRPGARRAYILILVLGLTAVVTALGMSFINANGTAAIQGDNRYRSARAQYVSESGISVAAHYLMNPPTGVTFGDYWRGAASVAVDASSDFVNVQVAQD